MKLYTKRGDRGETVLFGGKRVLKSDARVQAYGDVDETNAAVGLVVSGGCEAELADFLRQVQSDLLTLGSVLATPADSTPPVVWEPARVTPLEQWIDRASRETPPLQSFILPGGTEVSARLHLARAVCRRAERSLVALSQQEAVPPETIVYMNRLSDLLFALGRLVHHRAGGSDTAWTAPKASR